MRVLIVDDSPAACALIAEALSFDRDLDVVGTAADGVEALSSIQALRPDIVTLDLGLPQLDGFAVLDGLRAMQGPRPDVVIVTISDAALPGELTVVRKAQQDPMDLMASVLGAVLTTGAVRSARSSFR